VDQDVERQIVDLIARKKKLDPARISSSSTFEELGLDSLDAADLIFTIEDTFKIVVSDEAALSMKSVGQVVAAIRTLTAGSPGAA
jgi:acyl carrier protein